MHEGPLYADGSLRQMPSFPNAFLLGFTSLVTIRIQKSIGTKNEIRMNDVGEREHPFSSNRLT